MKKTLLYLPLLAAMILVSGCAVRNLAYNRDRILSKYSDYDVVLNGETIDFGQYWLDKRNIRSVRLDRERLRITISQKRPTSEYISLPDVVRDSTGMDRGLIIIDGVYLEGITKAEKSGIKSLRVFWTPELIGTSDNPRPVLFIICNKNIRLR